MDGNWNSESAHVSHISVDADIQRNGFGRRLLQAFTAEALDSGAHTLSADLISHSAIELFSRLFGDSTQLSINDIPCSIDEAKQYVPGERRTVHFAVDLDTINTDGWERIER